MCNREYAWRPLSKDEWEESVHTLEALGSFYIDNTKILIEMVKQKKLKPNMKPKEKA